MSGNKSNHPKKKRGPYNQFCKHGHEVAIVGRDTQGMCNSCTKNRHWSYEKLINFDNTPFTVINYLKRA